MKARQAEAGISGAEAAGKRFPITTWPIPIRTECVKTFESPLRDREARKPCGVAVADDLLGAYDLAFHTDTESAFGGIIAFNRELDGTTPPPSSSASLSR